MAKMKSHSGAKKRFKRTSGGKWVHAKAGRRHLLAGESATSGRARRKKGILPRAEGKALGRYLPYA